MHRWLLTVLLVVGLLGACDSGGGPDSDASDRAEPRPVEKAADNTLSSEPYLRSRLPGNTAAYLRVPSPVGFVAGPGGGSFDEVKRSQANVEAVTAIRDAVDGSFAASRFGASAPLIEFLVKHVWAPLEVALVAPEQGPPTAARALVTTGLGLDGASAVNEYLQTFADRHPRVTLHQRAAANTDAVIGAGPVQLRLRWLSGEQRLMGLAGIGVVAASDLDQRLDDLSAGGDHPMLDAEARIDAGKRGLLAWVDGERAATLMRQPPQPGIDEKLERAGLQQADWLALGWGSKEPVVEDGRRKSRLKLVVEAPRTGIRSKLPAPGNAFDIDAAGDIDWAVSGALPDVETWRAIDSTIEAELADTLFGADSYETFIDQAAPEYLGFSIEEAVRSLGPEVMVFSDDAGRFTAVRTGRPSDGDDIIERFHDDGPVVAHHTYTLDGRDYHASRIERPMAGSSTDEVVPELSWSWLFQVPYRVYWVRDRDFVVMAATPQALMERERYHREASVADWLAREQGQSLDNAILAMSASFEGGPELLYRQYLQMISHMGDAVGAEIDPFAFPTATEAGLPAEGTYGLQVDNGPDRFSIELTFEQTPADAAIFSPYGMTATLGILAAIAVPQYQEYVERSEGVQPDAGPDVWGTATDERRAR